MPRLSSDSQCSAEEMTIGSRPSSQSTKIFEEDFTKQTRKSLHELSPKGLRNRLSGLVSHIEAVAEQEEVSPMNLASYLLMICSQQVYNFSTANLCKDIIAEGGYSPVCNQLSSDKAAFLMDSLEIGKKKYIDLRRVLLSDGIKIPGYNKIATHRAHTNLADEVFFVRQDYPIGIGVSYRRLLKYTVNRILSEIATLDDNNNLKIRISDGLDGSGCHRVYQQVNHPDLSTKNFILFGFKVITISDAEDELIWKNKMPNSPFSIRPITILALQENEQNIKFLMDTLINEETTQIQANGLELTNGTAQVEILRSQLDGKMAKILSGAGGACCQFCTATFAQIHDLNFVNQGFPMNRSISDAKALFEEVNEEEFLYLKSNERFNITHKPISELNIVPSSPLHAYLRCFGWFLSLVSHLHAGKHKWSPTSTKVKDAKIFLAGLIQDKLNLMIDIPSTQGGTSTTGNVVRQCFIRENDNAMDFLYWILTLIPHEYRQSITEVHTYLGAIIRVYNSSRIVDTEKLSQLCLELYAMIIDKFPWANITPTLHKLLAHAPEIISNFNDGHGLEELSEEGLEACNKYIRRFRDRLARKFSFEENLKDIFLRLVSQSDPILIRNRKFTIKKALTCNSELKSNQDMIVNSLLSDES